LQTCNPRTDLPPSPPNLFLHFFSVVTHFLVPIKNIYIYIYQKKYSDRNPKNNRSEKMMLECRKIPKLVEEIQKCKKLKFDSESPVDKENSIRGRKV